MPEQTDKTSVGDVFCGLCNEMKGATACGSQKTCKYLANALRQLRDIEKGKTEYLGDRSPHCPVCGEELSGGSKDVCYYKCGGHFWVEFCKESDMWVMRGHCHNRENKLLPTGEGKGE